MRQTVQEIIFLMMIFIFPYLSCVLLQTYTDKTQDLLPGESEIPGWILDTPPKNFTGENIQEHIKEPEDIRLLNAYRIKELSAAKYKSLSKSPKEITAEIFCMDSSLNAFGILSMERVEEPKESALCEDSYSTPQGLFSRKGNYYIRIKTNAGYSGSIADFEMLSKTICNKIQNNSPLPGYLSLFGKKDSRISLVYRVGGHPKLPDLKNIFTRKIDISGNIRTAFFSKRDSSYISIWEFSNLLKDKNRQFILSSAGNLQIAFLKINDSEFIFISVFKEWIFGIIGAVSMAEGEKTINYLYNDLTEFLKSSR